MLGNFPALRFNRHHHWLWLLRRSFPRGNGVAVIGLFLLAGLFLIPNLMDTVILQWFGILLLGMLIIEGGWLFYVFLDWRMRNIRLYSDGRLDYEYGILFRKGTSISMRFGAVRYIYHDRIGTWLDCADLILPFDTGAILDIPDFRLFWNIAQGRI